MVPPADRRGDSRDKSGHLTRPTLPADALEQFRLPNSDLKLLERIRTDLDSFQDVETLRKAINYLNGSAKPLPGSAYSERYNVEHALKELGVAATYEIQINTSSFDRKGLMNAAFKAQYFRLTADQPLTKELHESLLDERKKDVKPHSAFSYLSPKPEAVVYQIKAGSNLVLDPEMTWSSHSELSQPNTVSFYRTSFALPNWLWPLTGQGEPRGISVFSRDQTSSLFENSLNAPIKLTNGKIGDAAEKRYEASIALCIVNAEPGSDLTSTRSLKVENHGPADLFLNVTSVARYVPTDLMIRVLDSAREQRDSK